MGCKLSKLPPLPKDSADAPRPVTPASAAPFVLPFPQTIHHVLLVLIGGHCSGKSTLCRKIAECGGSHWVLGEELGDVLRRPDQRAINALDSDFDRTVLRAESERDGVALAAAPPRHRVVETWHPGNLAWAQARVDDDTDSPAFLELLRDTRAAVASYVSGGAQGGALVLVQPLRCDTEAVKARRKAGASERVQPASLAALPHGRSMSPRLVAASKDEDGVVAFTQHVGDNAVGFAKQMGLTMLPVIDTGREGVDSAMLRVLAEVKRLAPAAF